MRVAIASLCAFLALLATSRSAHCSIGWAECMNEDAPFAYEDISNDNGTITHTIEGTTIDGKKRNNSWTYFFEIPPTSRHCTVWEAKLEVADISGYEWAGLAIDSLKSAVSFRVNARGEAQLAYLRSNDSAVAAETFTLPRSAAESIKDGFSLGIYYDIQNDELVCLIDDLPVKAVSLPYCGIPPFVSVTGFSMESVTAVDTSRGSVTFGKLFSIGSR